MQVRKLGIALGAAGILASTVVLTSGATSAQSDDALRLIAVTTEFGPEEGADSVGDTFAFGGDLYAARRDGRRLASSDGGRRDPVGRYGVACTITSIEEGEATCSGALNLDQPRRRGDDGQITLQALVSDGGEDEDSVAMAGRDRDRDLEKWAITGGTDDFDGVGGTMTVRDINDEAALLTFRFSD